MALDRRWFLRVTAELQRMPIDNLASILLSQKVRFCLLNTVVFSCLFCISAECPSRFFVKCVSALATKCTVKEK